MRNIEPELIINYFLTDDMISVLKDSPSITLNADNLEKFVFNNLESTSKFVDIRLSDSSKGFYAGHYFQLMFALLKQLSDKDWEYILSNIKVRFYEMEEKESLIEKGLIEEEV